VQAYLFRVVEAVMRALPNDLAAPLFRLPAGSKELAGLGARYLKISDRGRARLLLAASPRYLQIINQSRAAFPRFRYDKNDLNDQRN